MTHLLLVLALLPAARAATCPPPTCDPGGQVEERALPYDQTRVACAEGGTLEGPFHTCDAEGRLIGRGTHVDGAIAGVTEGLEEGRVVRRVHWFDGQRVAACRIDVREETCTLPWREVPSDCRPADAPTEPKLLPTGELAEALRCETSFRAPAPHLDWARVRLPMPDTSRVPGFELALSLERAPSSGNARLVATWAPDCVVGGAERTEPDPPFDPVVLVAVPATVEQVRLETRGELECAQIGYAP